MAVIVLKNLDSVRDLKARVGVFDRPSAFRVNFEFSTGLNEKTQHHYQKWIAFGLADCGCGLASLILFITPIMSYILGYLQLSPHWENLWSTGVIAVFLALTGKLTSLILSHRMTHNMLDSVIAAGQQ